jgi:Na+/phosphate symporter
MNFRRASVYLCKRAAPGPRLEGLEMTTITATATVTNTTVRRSKAKTAGYAISAVVLLFLGFDMILHLLNPASVAEATAEVGAPEWLPYVCGAAMAACLAVHLYPRTAVLGGVGISAYLGGATAVNLSYEQPAFNVVFAIAVGVLFWVGFGLRDHRVKVLFTR